MDKTGIGLMEILGLVAILLPLFPVLIIFVSKAYKQDRLALLMVFCLVSFIQNLILYTPKAVTVDLFFVRAVFQLAQFIILMILLEMVVLGRWLKEGIKILLVSFLSVVITIYIIQGIPRYIPAIELFQSLMLILITLTAIFQLIRSHDIHIFLSPMFWTAGGTFFYYSMFFLTQSIPEHILIVPGEPQQKKVLLLIIILIQFVFYIAAAKVAGNKKEDEVTGAY